MGEEIAKPGWKPTFQSEYSMGSLDFQRYNDHLKYLEYWCGVINSTAVPELLMIQNYFAGITTLYKLWRPIIAVPTKVKLMDDSIEEAKKMKRIWETAFKTGTPYSDINIQKLHDKLDKIHTELMDLKQVIGLGIVVKRNLSAQERIRSGVKGNKDYSNLPEA